MRQNLSSALLMLVALTTPTNVFAQQQQTTTLLGRFFGGFLSYFTPDVDDLINIAIEQAQQQGGGGGGGKDKNKGKGDSSSSGGVVQDAAGNAAENVQFLACTQQTACFNPTVNTPGAWTCRPQYLGHMSLCVPTILGVTVGREGDECGCCDGNCPVTCECECTNARGQPGVMTHFNLMFGLVQFEQCLESTVADAATSFTTLDISCSTLCNQQPEEETDLDDGGKGEQESETTTEEDERSGFFLRG